MHAPTRSTFRVGCWYGVEQGGEEVKQGGDGQIRPGNSRIGGTHHIISAFLGPDPLIWISDIIGADLS